MARFPAILALGLALGGSARAMDLAVSGAYDVSVSAVDLTAGAGSPLPSTVTSATSEVLLDVAATTGAADAWRVDVRRIDGVWDPDIRVWIRRTGEGSGPGTVTDGTAWVEVGPTLVPFFSGTADCGSTPVQIRITGLSLAVPPGALATVLQYTLVDVVD